MKLDDLPLDVEKITAQGLWPASGFKDCEPPNHEQVAACRAWLREFATPTKTIRRNHSSYGLKHSVEVWSRQSNVRHMQTDWLGRKWIGSLYISNGAFIEAARLEGYRIQRVTWGSPNAFFNMKLHKRAYQRRET